MLVSRGLGPAGRSVTSGHFCRHLGATADARGGTRSRAVVVVCQPASVVRRGLDSTPGARTALCGPAEPPGSE